jgi:serine/threonine protein phosphatase 1
MLKSLLQQFWSRSDAAAPGHALPAGQRVYAIGDVHGRLDKLRAMESAVADHFQRSGGIDSATVIFLGDYIDRGPDSRAVVEHLLPRRFAGLPARCLLGNHEAAMLDFLEHPAIGPAWLSYGGMATLASYGVSMPGGPVTDRMEALRQSLIAQVPRAHVEFMAGLETWIQLGGYLFVHAGVRPGRALDKQSRTDMLEIREPFLSYGRALPWRVVHGHTVTDEPEIRANRIGIDTGAYAGGRLTCAVIEGATVGWIAA